MLEALRRLVDPATPDGLGAAQLEQLAGRLLVREDEERSAVAVQLLPRGMFLRHRRPIEAPFAVQRAVRERDVLEELIAEPWTDAPNK